MKIIGNQLETIHRFRHDNVSDRVINDSILGSLAGLTTVNNIHRLQLLYLDTNDTFYLVENTSSMAHALTYNDGAIVIHEWSPADIVALMKSYDAHGFDNYFQILVHNTAESHAGISTSHVG
ncbi:hypothetical protein H9L19_01845 [Weissella diestrammenae]|uniref:Uncharacterized protein n=1 Tax=Weissella diestrammenae TaxID=1162633 RepID=A0A7G9T6B8_9LACO|nr:hypothetical protein [Weissella diestrammenae]MCM0583311.1 hypothetical protein [Weissella diestrammenae]QNN75643.1 hypothetical protein H9L19_01845 [Weissella diestrammenae]